MTDRYEPFAPRLAFGPYGKAFMELGYHPPDDWYEIARADFLDSVPAFARWHLDNIDYRAFLTLWPLDVDVAHKYDGASRDDYDWRSSQDQIGGCYFPKYGVLYSSVAVANAEGDVREIRAPQRVAAVLRHETAHALLMAFGKYFEKHVLSEAVRQDVVALGGYEAMRAGSESSLTPTPAMDDRDILEIGAEALASLWPGGGCRPTLVTQRLYPRTVAACMHFLHFLKIEKTETLLDRDAPAHRALAARAQGDLREENRDTLGLSYAISRAFDPRAPLTPREKAAPPRLRGLAKNLIDSLETKRIGACAWGVELRDTHIAPVNVAVTLLQEVTRLSVGRDTAADMNRLWGDVMPKMPLHNDDTLRLLRSYAPLILDMQRLRLDSRQNALFRQSIADLQTPEWMRANPGLARQIARAAAQMGGAMGENDVCRPQKRILPAFLRPAR